MLVPKLGQHQIDGTCHHTQSHAQNGKGGGLPAVHAGLDSIIGKHKTQRQFSHGFDDLGNTGGNHVLQTLEVPPEGRHDTNEKQSGGYG